MKLKYVVVAMGLIVSSLSQAGDGDLSQSELGVHVRQAGMLGNSLGKGATVRLVKSHKDDIGMIHVRFAQYHRGVRVYGGEIITHSDKNSGLTKETDALFRNINVDTVPTLTETAAKVIVSRNINADVADQYLYTAELVVYPKLTLTHVGAGQDATAYEYVAEGYYLAYIISSILDVLGKTDSQVHVVDAKSGGIIDSWDNLQRAEAKGTGKSQYSGQVDLDTERPSGVLVNFNLRDLTRGTVAGKDGVGNSVRNTNGIYTDSDNMWGDGNRYNGSDTTSANGQTVAVDAAYGLQVTWDMYKKVFSRDGIDNKNTATAVIVHASGETPYWFQPCFCARFTDGGTMYNQMASLDIVGHELSHGVYNSSASGGTSYSGETVGLSESNGDIMGTMAEFYGKGGGASANGTSIPASGGNWTIGEQISSTPIRYLYKPSLDGASPDAWNSSITSLVSTHARSGPGNRAFYFLSQGSSSGSSSNFYSSFLPGGMIGVGNDRAARIHYRAITTYYTSNTTYTGARDAYISAATDLYGSKSLEVNAVKNAFAAVNVGSAGYNAAGVLLTPILMLLLN